jgi:hypothetical protein
MRMISLAVRFSAIVAADGWPIDPLLPAGLEPATSRLEGTQSGQPFGAETLSAQYFMTIPRHLQVLAENDVHLRKSSENPHG